ncbi:MAG TPA: nuclear transport factor 2 family protein [Solirubrobacteraceae bacterium]|nr:nuclear transport factor 2 family protein [Solirubrobacteraceae bacterium]
MATSSTPSAALADLADREAVRACLLRYGRGIDRADEQLARSAFHPDATVEISDAGGATQVDDLVATAAPRLSSQHYISNAVVQVDGDAARSESSYLSVLATVANDDAPSRVTFAGGRCVDRLQRREGTWAIAHRTLIVEWRAVTDAPTLEAYLQGMPSPDGLARDLPDGSLQSASAQLALDRAAVHEQLLLTTRGIDRLDAALLDDSLGAATTLRMGAMTMPGTAFTDRARADAGSRIATQHFVANHLIEVEGDRARSEAYLFGSIGYAPGAGPPQLTGDKGGVVLSGLRYVDLWSRVDGRWRLTERVLGGAWSVTLDVAAMATLADDPHADGHRDEQDPSYRRAAWTSQPQTAEATIERDAIERCVLDRVRGIDQRDAALLEEVHDDPAAAGRLLAAQEPGTTTRHHVLNCLVDLGAGPDRASCETYVLEVRAEGDAFLLEGRRELVDLVHVAGRWRIREVTPVREWRAPLPTASWLAS